MQHDDNRTATGTYLKNSFFIVCSRFTTITGSVVFLLVISRLLPIADFGLYIVITALIAVCAPFLDAGQEHILVRELPLERWKDPLSSALAVRVMMVIPFTALLFIVILSGQFTLEFWPCFLMMAGATFFNIALSSTFRVVFVVFQDLRRDFVLSLVIQGVRLCGLGILLLSKVTLFGVFLVSLCSEIIGAIVAIFLTRRFGLKWALPESGDVLRYFLTSGLPLMLVIFLNESIRHGDVLIVTFFLGKEAAALFGAAYRIVMTLLLASTAVLWILMPKLSVLETTAPEHLGFVIFRTVRYILLFWLLPVIVLATHASLILGVFGKDYTAASSLFVILLASLIPQLIVYFLSLILVIQKRQKIMSYIFAFFLILNLGLDILLVPSFGAIGAAVGKLLSQILCFLAFMFMLRSYITLNQLLPFLARSLLIALIAVPILLVIGHVAIIFSIVLCVPLIVFLIILLGGLTAEDTRILSTDRIPVLGPRLNRYIRANEQRH